MCRSGKNGKNLSRQITEQLSISLRYTKCDLILVIDDLDCCPSEERQILFCEAIKKVPGTEIIPLVIAFAAPEIESWLIADWDNTVAKDIDFRGSANAMKHWLSHEKKVPFPKTETFGEYDPEKNACMEKLSCLIIESSLQHEDKTRYSKGAHTPRLLQELRPGIVAKKCPLFRKFFLELSHHVRNINATVPN